MPFVKEGEVLKYGWINTRRYPTREFGKKTKATQLWENIKLRCNELGKVRCKERQYSYKEVHCCDEWKDCSNFTEWFHEQKRNGLYRDGWELDKEILSHGNTLYSPNTCCFVPAEINKKFVKLRPNSGVGRSRGKFYARINEDYNRKYLGTFNTEEEAREAYLSAKTDVFYSLIEKYREELPTFVVEGLENFVTVFVETKGLFDNDN